MSPIDIDVLADHDRKYFAISCQVARHACRRIYILPRILSFFFFVFRRLISELAERNSTKIGHMLESNCDLKTRVQNQGCPLSLQIWGPKTTFWDDFAT